jgi:transcriptional regulator with GAF, ATPase, and Fis domain
LESTNWQVSGDKGAANLLGIKRTTLEARMKKLNIEKKR